ncbi:hypothetical protein [Companilactobacillus mishanensis]|uniref:hypothetical protein n=1 Tax=Companilactobacillus mishanensis TaxID=2486008 RepID=UPI0012D560B8|nr:hypothetical protein [Companilactobacillus mishanensis]MQS89722.1 hypothetical protein [Companilactobacillus mishanensis]
MKYKLGFMKGFFMDNNWIGDTELNNLFPQNNLDMFTILDDNNLLHLTWSHKLEEDYLEMADEYFMDGVKIMREVINSGHDNLKDDTWFLSGMFILRQSIELSLKTKLLFMLKGQNKMLIQNILKEYKHDVIGLYRKLRDNGFKIDDCSNEKWLEQYLSGVEEIDYNSDFFRYPINFKLDNDSLPRFVDIYETTKKAVIAFSIIRSTLKNGQRFKCEIPSLLPDTNFFTPASDGIGNYYLKNHINLGNYFSVINGYLSVSEFLIDVNKGKGYRNSPALFSLRHLLELELKQIANSSFHKVNEIKFKFHSHRIYKDFWIKLLPVFELFGDPTFEANPLENAGSFIHQIQNFDNQGDFFRYPTSYNLSYNELNRPIDPINLMKSTRSITNLLEGYDSMFSDIADFENEVC